MDEVAKHEHRYIVLSEDEKRLGCSYRGCKRSIPVTGRHGSVAQSG